MKKYFLMMSLFVGALLMTACGGKDSDSDDKDLSAKETVEKFLDGVKDKDVDAVRDCIDIKGHSDDELDELAEDEFQRNGGIKSFKITDSEEQDGEAHVKARIKYRDGSIQSRTYRLREKKGSWLIVN